jgi:uncharacterized LabA/DUF88 family protein
MNHKTKTYCFIDSQNLHLGIKDQGWILDYKKLFIYLKEKYKVDNVYFYIGYIKENQKVYDFLTQCGYKIVFKNTKQFGKSRDQIKGNIDVELTVDAIRKHKEYHKAIFISADGDFVALYDYLSEEQNKEIQIIIPNQFKFSSFLLKYNKDLRFMNDLRQKLGKHK